MAVKAPRRPCAQGWSGGAAVTAQGPSGEAEGLPARGVRVGLGAESALASGRRPGSPGAKASAEYFPPAGRAAPGRSGAPGPRWPWQGCAWTSALGSGKETPLPGTAADQPPAGKRSPGGCQPGLWEHGTQLSTQRSPWGPNTPRRWVSHCPRALHSLLVSQWLQVMAPQAGAWGHESTSVLCPWVPAHSRSSANVPGGGEGGTLSQSCGPKTGGWGQVSFNPQDLQGLSPLGRLRGRAVSCSHHGSREADPGVLAAEQPLMGVS